MQIDFWRQIIFPLILQDFCSNVNHCSYITITIFFSKIFEYSRSCYSNLPHTHIDFDLRKCWLKAVCHIFPPIRKSRLNLIVRRLERVKKAALKVNGMHTAQPTRKAEQHNNQAPISMTRKFVYFYLTSLFQIIQWKFCRSKGKIHLILC